MGRKDRILVLGAGKYLAPALLRIAAGGYFVLVADRDPHAPGRVHADAFRPIDITDKESILAWAREEAIDGIMPINDFGTPAAAYVAATLRLPGNSEACAEIANDKGLMRRRWAAHGVPQPEFIELADHNLIAPACRAVGFPCVVKPAFTGGGGRGISVVRGEEDIEWAVTFARPHARNGRYVVERYIEGTELTVETASVEGRHRILAVSDKVKAPLRTRVATSLHYPAAITDEQLARLDGLCAAALDAIEFVDGLAHTEVILDEAGDTIQFVEVGARPGGGHIFHTLIEAVSGIDAPALNAAILTGRRPPVPQPLRRGGVYRFFNPAPGILRRVANIEAARSIPGVLDFGIIAEPGDTVGALASSLQRPGFVVTAAATREAAIAIADRVEATLIWEIDPLDRNPYAFTA